MKGLLVIMPLVLLSQLVSGQIDSAAIREMHTTIEYQLAKHDEFSYQNRFMFTDKKFDHKETHIDTLSKTYRAIHKKETRFVIRKGANQPGKDPWYVVLDTETGDQFGFEATFNEDYKNSLQRKLEKEKIYSLFRHNQNITEMSNRIPVNHNGYWLMFFGNRNTPKQMEFQKFRKICLDFCHEWERIQNLISEHKLLVVKR